MSIKKNIYKALLIILFAFVYSVEAAAATNRWWVADNDGTDKYWNNNANWSTTRYGSGGASAPTNNSFIANFTDASTVDAKLSANVYKIRKLKVLNGYSGNINLNGYHLASTQGPMINDGNVLVTAGSFFQTWGWLYINAGGAVTASGDGSRIKLGHNLSINGGAAVTDLLLEEALIFMEEVFLTITMAQLLCLQDGEALPEQLYELMLVPEQVEIFIIYINLEISILP